MCVWYLLDTEPIAWYVSGRACYLPEREPIALYVTHLGPLAHSHIRNSVCLVPPGARAHDQTDVYCVRVDKVLEPNVMTSYIILCMLPSGSQTLSQARKCSCGTL